MSAHPNVTEGLRGQAPFLQQSPMLYASRQEDHGGGGSLALKPGRGVNGNIRRAYGPGLLVTAWLAAVAAATGYSLESVSWLQLACLCSLIPAGLYAREGGFLLAPIFRRSPAVLALTALMFTTIVASISQSENVNISMAYAGATAVSFLTCGGVWALLGARGERAFLNCYSCLGVALVGAVSITSLGNSGRLGAIRDPNSTGLILMGVLITAWAVRPWLLRFAALGIAGALLMSTSSRSAILGSMVATIVILGFQAHNLRGVRKWLLGVGPLLAVCMLCWVYFDRVQEYGNLVFQLNDPWRGLGTGATGRAEAWRQTIDLFLSHPLLGIGYRTHEAHLIGVTSSHNGYLTVLAEVGIMGALPTLLLVLAGLRRLWRDAVSGCEEAPIGAGLMCACLVHSCFERFLFNFGNPTSLLFIMYVLRPYGLNRRRAGSAAGTPGPLPVSALKISA